MIDFPKNKKIILFDGICNLCNDSVLKIIKHDKKDLFVFAALQSESGQKITNYLKIDTSKVDAIILYEPGVAYEIKSTAALRIMKDFGGFWFVTQIFRIFPENIRDWAYDYIAKNRYKWFGKKESCMIPTSELQAKFLN
jgi:predicted DCC family thiol-disulfide oxidoreductase YuxK